MNRIVFVFLPYIVFLLISANGLRVGDVALFCACGKAILLTRCYAWL